MRYTIDATMKYIPIDCGTGGGSSKQPLAIKVVGIGGIGGCLLPVLCHFLAYSAQDKKITITLIDGDTFEPKNVDRQIFDATGNKAEIIGQKFHGLYGDRITIRREGAYVTDDNVVSLLREKDIIFLCVDNHRARKLVSDRCEELGDCTLISGGNELTDGNIQIFIRKDGEDVTLPLANDFHPEIRYPEDRNPGDVGCEELAQDEPQILIMNNAIAALMLNAFYAFLSEKLTYDEVYTDIITNTARKVCR